MHLGWLTKDSCEECPRRSSRHMWWQIVHKILQNERWESKSFCYLMYLLTIEWKSEWILKNQKEKLRILSVTLQKNQCVGVKGLANGILESLDWILDFCHRSLFLTLWFLSSNKFSSDLFSFQLSQLNYCAITRSSELTTFQCERTKWIIEREDVETPLTW